MPSAQEMITKTFQVNLGGKVISIETGKYAKQANAAVTVTCGTSVVLVTATASTKVRDGIDFFPLVVDVEQKMYAVGRVPGSFNRREGRPADTAILNARLIDRGIRPLFPEGYRNDVQIHVTVLSADGENPTDVLGILGAGVALSISNIPFSGPFAGVRVGRVENKVVFNPTYEEMAQSDMDLVVAGTRDAIMMVEAGLSEVPEDEVLAALGAAQKAIASLATWIDGIVQKSGKKKLEFASPITNETLKAFVWQSEKAMVKAMTNADKLARQEECAAVKTSIKDSALGLDAETDLAKYIAENKGELAAQIDGLEEAVFRALVTDKGVRIDGRRLDEIRPLFIERGNLPRAHGSGLFQRGQTQVLSVLTLGGSVDAQKLDSIEPETTKRYMHHYNFPAFSVGEVKPLRSPGRREIGHGALAERALIPVLPSTEEFPYVVRVVSEVLESNGSSSMASTCGSTLALLDGGVPIKRPVAGVAMGLIMQDKKFAVLTDIQGIEDHLGDMDFKVTGTSEGITALQMDIKITGIDLEVMETALEQARKGRLEILDAMNQVISKPAEELSSFAPRIISIKINPEIIGMLIGPAGKNIKKITEETGCKIEIEDTGIVNILTHDAAMARKARLWVESYSREVEVGTLYKGKVVRILNFGAFVELFPGKEGLVHISQLDNTRVAKVEDVVALGDEIFVKVLEIDSQGRVNLSKKVVTEEEIANFKED
jgi:polyribonucleotide nucleotidyltransferase